MKAFKKFLDTELGIFLSLFFITLFMIICIHLSFVWKDNDRKSKLNKVYKSYSVIVEDHICKCNITYKTDSIRIDSFIYFRSEGMDYQIDTSLIKQIK